MSIEAMRAVSKSGLAPSGRKFVAMALADYADEAWECFPQVKAIAAYTAQSERTVREHLDALEATGIITTKRIRRPDGTLGGYRFAIHADVLTSGEKQPVAKSASGEKQPVDKLEKPNKNNPAAIFATGEICRARSTSSKKEGSTKVERAQRARRKPELPIPDNWTPSDRNVADAEALGFSQQEIADEADRFRDRNLARGESYRDWNAAWRTWLRNARKFANGGVAGGKGAGGRGPGGSLASIAAWRRASGAV